MLAFISRLKDLVTIYQKEVVIAVALFAAAGAAGYGYLEYNGYRVRAAHKAYIDGMRYVNGTVDGKKTKNFDFEAVSFPTETEKWQKVEAVFDEHYKNFKSTSLAGLFLLQKAEAVRLQGKQAEAAALVEEAANMLPSKELGLAYQVKHALMLMDMDDAAHVEKGIQELKALALQEKSAVRDQALYRLGEYYWAKKDFAAAKGYFEKVAEPKQPNELVDLGSSQWIDAATQKLSMISSQQ